MAHPPSLELRGGGGQSPDAVKLRCSCACYRTGLARPEEPRYHTRRRVGTACPEPARNHAIPMECLPPVWSAAPPKLHLPVLLASLTWVDVRCIALGVPHTCFHCPHGRQTLISLPCLDICLWGRADCFGLVPSSKVRPLPTKVLGLSLSSTAPPPGDVTRPDR